MKTIFLRMFIYSAFTSALLIQLPYAIAASASSKEEVLEAKSAVTPKMVTLDVDSNNKILIPNEFFSSLEKENSFSKGGVNYQLTNVTWWVLGKADEPRGKGFDTLKEQFSDFEVSFAKLIDNKKDSGPYLYFYGQSKGKDIAVNVYFTKQS